ncbi:MAG: PIN domain-containing protein [Candidatus Eremiobacteraeota bacterium]|nr:PIN domain-containing protein [Candidatus Eremiobacteraeota bacterium]MBC5802504.1 PIN domain-containing protein [Candidatus Eremiobacteraeota bacterium]MBC5821606.1 PIN domain-containing protein [Candidatus Eremiobacteraeota bacterium]
MILVDANVALYAHHRQLPQHDVASGWFAAALSGSETIGFTSNVLLAFLRISTSSRVFERPLDMKTACEVVDGWFSSSVAALVEPGPRYWQLLRALLIDYRVRADLTSDAHLAAVALENGAQIVTTDRDFARFKSVQVRYLG